MDPKLRTTFIVVAVLVGIIQGMEKWSFDADVRSGKKRIVSKAELSQGGPKLCFGGIGQDTCSKAPPQPPVVAEADARRALASVTESAPFREPECAPSTVADGKSVDSKILLDSIQNDRGLNPMLIAYSISTKYGRSAAPSLLEMAKNSHLSAIVRYIAMLASLKSDYEGSRDQIQALERSSDPAVQRAAKLALQEVPKASPALCQLRTEYRSKGVLVK